MTSSVASEIERRRGPSRRPRTIAGALGETLIAASLELGHGATEETWPSAKYREDPVAFFRDVLGVAPWSRQVDVIEAVREHKRVAVASGHKVSKSHTAAGIALWFFCSFPDARVVMSSTTSRQVDQILWRELRMMRARAKREIDGDMHELARSGLKAGDFREIVGFTAREAEAVAGISGKNLLYILDEASGIDDAIFEAIEGNRAGGARLVMFSNPTRTEGEFYRAFAEKSAFYKTLRISSEESPNVIEGREIIPGLATREWIDEKREEWGEESPLYKVRVKGMFCLGEDGKIISLHAIGQSEARWYETPASGRLQIGVDPAGEEGTGDEIAFAWRRGPKMLGLDAVPRLSPEGHASRVAEIVRANRMAEERPLVVVDKGGPIGIKVYRFIRDQGEADGFDVLGLDSGDRAIRQPRQFGTIRDELHANGANWIREGGAILENAKLAKDIHAASWIPQLDNRSKVTPKREIRKALGRSPDRGDALLLSLWEVADADVATTPARAQAAEHEERIPVMDPYAALSTWGRS